MEVSEIQKNGIMEKWIGHKFHLDEEGQKEYCEFMHDAKKDLERMASGAGFVIIQSWLDFALSAILRHEMTDLEVCVSMADARTAEDEWHNKVLYYKYNKDDVFRLCKWSDIGNVLLWMVEEEKL